MGWSDLAPVVELRLEGVLAFDRGALDLEQVRGLVDEIVSPLVCRVKNNTRSTEFDVAPEDRLPRPELERRVLRDLVQRDSRYRDRPEFWVSLITEVKTMALAGSPPDAIVGTMRQRVAETARE